jgi:hypothetical protein
VSDLRYRIKLYGHTSDDTDEFRRKLSQVLGIAESESSDMLVHLPVIAKKRLKRGEVERFTDALLNIRALFLVEPETEEEEAEEAVIQHALQPQMRPEIQAKTRDDTFRSTFWMGVLAVAGGFFVIFSLVAYFSSYVNLYKKPEFKEQTLDEKTVSHSGPEAEKAASTVPVIEKRIETLMEEASGLAEYQKSLEQDIRAIHGKLGTDPLELRAKQQELQEIRTKIGSMDRELYGLRRDLKSFREQAAGLATPPIPR